MSPEMLTIIGVGVALAALIIVLMIFSELNALGKRIDRLEERFGNRFESFERSRDSFKRPNASLERRVAYLEGLSPDSADKNPFTRTKR